MAASIDFFRIYIDIFINRDVEVKESMTLARSAILPLQDLTIRQLGDEVLKRYAPDEEYRDFEFEVGCVRNARRSKLHVEDRVGDLVRCDEELGVMLIAVQRLASTRDLEENGRNSEPRVNGVAKTTASKRRRVSHPESGTNEKRRRVDKAEVWRAERRLSQDVELDVVVPESQLALDGYEDGTNRSRGVSPVLGDDPDVDVDVSMITAPETSEAIEASPPVSAQKVDVSLQLTNGARANTLQDTVPPQKQDIQSSHRPTVNALSSSLATKDRNQRPTPSLSSKTKLLPPITSSAKKPSKLRRDAPTIGSKLSQLISPSDNLYKPEDEIEDAEPDSVQIPSIESDLNDRNTTAGFVGNSQVSHDRGFVQARSRHGISEDLNELPEPLSIHTAAAVGYDTPVAILNGRRHPDVDVTEDNLLSSANAHDTLELDSSFQNVSSAQKPRASIFRCKFCKKTFNNRQSIDRHNRKFHLDKVAALREEMKQVLLGHQSETPSNSYVHLEHSSSNRQPPGKSLSTKDAQRKTPKSTIRDRTSVTTTTRSDDDTSQKSPSKAKKPSEAAVTKFTRPCFACQNAKRACTPNLNPRSRVCQPCKVLHRSYKMCKLDTKDNPLILYSAPMSKAPSPTQTTLATFRKKSRNGDESNPEPPTSPDMLAGSSKITPRKVINRVRSQDASKVDDEEDESVDAMQDSNDKQSDRQDPTEAGGKVQEEDNEEKADDSPARIENAPEPMDEDERQDSDNDGAMSDRSEHQDTRQLKSQVAQEVSTDQDHKDKQDEDNDEDFMADNDDMATPDVEDVPAKVSTKSISTAEAESQMSVHEAGENIPNNLVEEAPHTPEPMDATGSTGDDIGNENQPRETAVQSEPKDLSENEADSASESEAAPNTKHSSNASSDKVEPALAEVNEQSDSALEAGSDKEDDVDNIEEQPRTTNSKEDSMSPTPKSQIERESTLHMSSSKAAAAQSPPPREDDSNFENDSDSDGDGDIKNVKTTKLEIAASKSQSSASPSPPLTIPTRDSPRQRKPSSSLPNSKPSPKPNVPQASTARISHSIATTSLAESQQQDNSNSNTDINSDPDADIPNNKTASTSSPSSASESSAPPSFQRNSKLSQQPFTSKRSEPHKPQQTRQGQRQRQSRSPSLPSSPPFQTQPQQTRQDQRQRQRQTRSPSLPSSPPLQTQLPQKSISQISRPTSIRRARGQPPPTQQTQSHSTSRTVPTPSRPSQPRLLSHMAALSQLRPTPAAAKPLLLSKPSKRAPSPVSASETEESESGDSEVDSEDEVSEDTGFKEKIRVGRMVDGNGKVMKNGKAKEGKGWKGSGSGKGISAILKHVGRAKRRSAAFGR